MWRAGEPRMTWARACMAWPRNLVLLAFLSANGTAADAPHVVTSIAPVQALATGVTQGVTEPTLLLRGAGSPHDNQLRPSDASALADADIVFWVGPELERFLVRPLESLARSAAVVSLLEADGIVKLPARAHEIWHVEAHSELSQSSNITDPHIWLSPANARAIVTAMVNTLAEIDPAHIDVYHKNRDKLHVQLWELELDLSTTLAPVRNIPFVVLHDAYQYLEHAFGLRAVSAVTVGPVRRPGIQHLQNLTHQLDRVGAPCLFGEIGVVSPIATQLTRDWGLRSGQLDPLGIARQEGPEGYLAMMRANAVALVACLSEAP